MKTKLLFLIMTVSVIFNVELSNAQWNWVWRNPQPTGNAIFDVWPFSTTEYLAVGGGGLIMRSTDAGLTWTTIGSGVPNYLYAVYFADANNGWICGQDGVVLRTTDHGATWGVTQTGAGSLWDICFWGTSTGWACGDNGMIIKTTDGGTSWDSKNSGTTEWLTSICFTSATEGYIAGAGGTILKTVNGGSIWGSKTTNTTNDLHTIFEVGSVMYSFGLSGTVIKSNDGGSTWPSASSGLLGDIRYACAVDANNMWVVGQGNVVSKTTDGGATWNSKNPWIGGNPDNGPTITGDFYCAYFSSSTTGIVCGSNGVIYRTTDDGATWTSRSISFTGKDAVDITFSDSQRGFFLVNPNDATSNSLFRTTDGGASWSEVSNTNPVNFVRIFSGGSGIRYAGDTRGLETTTDYGATWASNGGSAPAGSSYPKFEFANTSVGWSGSFTSPFSYKTTDGGKNWTTVTRPYVDVIGGYSVPDANTIWIAEWSDGVNIILSTDGGATWANPAGSVSGNRTCVFAFDASKAWVGSSNGKIYKTTNGAGSFTEVDPMMGGNAVSDVKFLTADTGFVVGAAGNFSVTYDGGASWTPGNNGTDWTKIGVASHRDILFVGKLGTVLQGMYGPATGVSISGKTNPEAFALSQNFPNPFNPSTAISFDIPSKSFVTLKIFDLLGREVATIVSEEMTPGHYQRMWDASRMPSGIYFCRLQSGSFTETRKLVVLK
ncbi:MAG TPA: YCF48-related protein [Candidatus Kryptonia bacterium]